MSCNKCGRIDINNCISQTAERLAGMDQVRLGENLDRPGLKDQVSKLLFPAKWSLDRKCMDEAEKVFMMVNEILTCNIKMNML